MTSFDQFYQASGLYYPRPSPMLVDYVASRNVQGPALDAGSGDGRNSLWLLDRGFTVYAIDCSAIGVSKLVEYATGLGIQRNLTTEIGDLTATPSCFERKYGLVVAATVLCQFRAEVKKVVFRSLINCLVPGGVLYISGFTQDDPSFLRKDEEVSETSRFLVSHFGPNELLNDLEEFKVVRYFEDTEIDSGHGPVHRHGVARAIAIKS